MRGFADIIDVWPDPSVRTFAGDLGIREGTASAWKVRGIPAQWWVAVIAAARARNIEGVTFDVLAHFAAGAPPRPALADAVALTRRYGLGGMAILWIDNEGQSGVVSWGEGSEVAYKMQRLAQVGNHWLKEHREG